MKFSVLMSVYKNEKPEYFRAALESVLSQTMMPDEIILIRDGEVPVELQNVIDSFVNGNKTLFTYIPLDKNGGLGNALNIGLKEAKNELVARVDTDDICVPTRFEKQVTFMIAHPDISVCGGQIYEQLTVKP